MGMYTELNIGVRFKQDTPDNIINIIKHMIDNNINAITTDHPLFSSPRWRIMLTCYSYYFDGRADSNLRYDEIDESYHLNVRCNLKNYDNEIELFLDFIRPYLETEGFLGYMRYEENENPTLIYNNYGYIIKCPVNIQF
jgi:hypothetical protein